jgi:protein SCO1/2
MSPPTRGFRHWEPTPTMPVQSPRPISPQPPRPAPMPGAVKAMIAVFGTIFLLSLAGLLAIATLGRQPGSPVSAGVLVPDDTVRGLAMPAFVATTQDGRQFTRADLLNQVTIADFMFTHCPFICPVLTARMKQMSEELKGTGVRFMSMTVDPTRDTPQRLAAYAAEKNADTSRWTFLNADMDTVRRVVVDSLRFELSTDAKTTIPLPDGTMMENIIHPGHFVLLGPGAEVLGIYRASDATKVAALVARAREADAAIRR